MQSDHPSAGYCLALDMTARDFQNEAKAAGAPWFLAKSFDTACPVSAFVDKAAVADPHRVRLRCWVNDALKQDGFTGDLLFTIPQMLAYVSR